MSNKHPDFNSEAKHLEYVKGYLNKTIEVTDVYLNKYKGSMREAFANLDYLDSSDSYINIILNTRFMEMAEKNYTSLNKVKDKPYFARIDFQGEGSLKKEELYIGKASLIKAEDNEQLIIDWRAPVASVYYEGKLGKTNYTSVEGQEYGELFLKRQFIIDEGKIEDIIDIDIAANDPLLQSALKSSAEKRLKDIASTIQAEQNKVIRADMHVPLIVQGVAGSGKTTIALHRIAYFIYTYEKTFDPENFMIIAPNKMFINYISEVLPELGVEKVKQTTYIEFMNELLGLGKKQKLRDTTEKLLDLMDQQKDQQAKDKIIWICKFKGSLELKNIIDSYVAKVERLSIPKKDFKLEDKVIVSRREVANYILKDYKFLPLYKRFEQLKFVLKAKLKVAKEDVLKQTEDYYTYKIDSIRSKYPDPLERQRYIVPVFDERDKKLEKIKADSKTLVKKYIDGFPKVDLYDFYWHVMTNTKILGEFSEQELDQQRLEDFCSHNEKLQYSRTIELEDYAPLVYLKHLLYGFKDKITIQSVVIDEAQDFSLFQFYVIKEILNTEKITILGDISQGIYSYRGTENWQDVMDKVFTTRQSNYITLKQSYRTTIEIMELANEAIKNLKNEGTVLAEPVIRHGDKPSYKSYKDDIKLLADIEDKIGKLVEKYKSIAVICKNRSEGLRIKRYLDKGKKVQARLLDEKQESYEAGAIIVPSYLAKGLEFDAVLIVNMDEGYYNTSLDIKLLYVALTRALHEVHIYSIDGQNPLLDKVNSFFFAK